MSGFVKAAWRMISAGEMIIERLVKPIQKRVEILRQSRSAGQQPGQLLAQIMPAGFVARLQRLHRLPPPLDPDLTDHRLFHTQSPEQLLMEQGQGGKGAALVCRSIAAGEPAGLIEAAETRIERLGACQISRNGRIDHGVCDSPLPEASCDLSDPNRETKEIIMAFTLPPLPYERTALQPHITENTLNFHYGKHHQAYLDNLNKLVPGSAFEGLSLEDVIRQSHGKAPGVFNNSAQVWNHTFYWNSMKPGGGGEPTGPVASRIDADFGGYEGFRKAFTEAGATQFGSGWAWLVLSAGKLEVRKTGNAETPLTEAGVTPLMTMDVWEHAYYLDFQNARPRYMDVFLANLVNWDFVNANLAAA